MLGLRDLDDVLLEALRIKAGSQKKFRHLLVDEFQDINAVQHELVNRWSAKSQSLFVIGDPDQAIYGFRGAKADCFDTFLAAHPDALVIRISRNYRSTPQVLEAALSVITHNPGMERSLAAHQAAGEPIRLMEAPDAFSEAVGIAKEIGKMVGGVDMLEAQHAEGLFPVVRSFSDIAVLCRTHRQLEQIENALVHDSIPCVISGHDDFLSSKTVQGMIGFFASLLDTHDSASVHAALDGLWRLPSALSQRAIVALSAFEPGRIDPDQLRQELCDFPLLQPWAEAVCHFAAAKREKPRKQLEQLARMCEADDADVQKLLNTAVFYDDMAELIASVRTGEEADVRRAAGSGYASGAVRLMTLHGAKGLEFPVVFLAGVTSGTLPMERAHQACNIEEERRLFFVGITRAREELILSCGGSPSSFLSELPSHISRSSLRARNRVPKMEQLSLF